MCEFGRGVGFAREFMNGRVKRVACQVDDDIREERGDQSQTDIEIMPACHRLLEYRNPFDEATDFSVLRAILAFIWALWHQSRMTIWSLKPGLEKKFSFGHPWVFSSDLAHSPKGVSPGEAVELRDSGGRFLAKGYGHPNTLISFRILTRDQNQTVDSQFFLGRFQDAARVRKDAGVYDWSHRWIYAEGDSLPGLIIDRFRLDPAARGGRHGQVLVLQSSTAGMDRLRADVLAALEQFVNDDAQSGGPAWNETAVVFANDSKSREMEGVSIEAKRVERPLDGVDFSVAPILIQPALAGLEATRFHVDFIGGQKTGFFLDQRTNVRAVAEVLAQKLRTERRPVRVLDLCCYVGQWSTQIAAVCRAHDVHCEATMVDTSAKALELAVRNVEANGGRALPLKVDVLEGLGRVAAGAFDIVICDPPAFIKKKKDIAAGQAAYVKINREAMKKAAHQALYFSSSCSGLLEEEAFRGALARAAAANREREVRWIFRGSHGPDHPQKPEFPQGSYLKSWLGLLM